MIVIFLDNIKDFLLKLEKRVMDDIFYEFREINKEDDISSTLKIEIIFHFLGKIESSLILYETKMSVKKPSSSNIDEEVIQEIQNIFDKVNSSIRLVKGKIREIFLSYSL
ncbi:MAG: hypothetical protein BAJALOKI1v1_850010 [Promethearchaeota archaeon]|nr:MAG: hypothetical protein BAJALOKI1v1_850010 [Candidatus Lokiarchaeota archaeon]